MTLWRLVLKEIGHRKLNFSLGLLSVIVATGCLVGTQGLLQNHDRNTDQILAKKEHETDSTLKKLNDDYRKITKNLGFNVLILPKEQNLSDLYAQDYADKYMPESYVEKLANSNIVTVDHLLPSLQQKLKWPEKHRTVILVGVRGEVPIVAKSLKKPLIQPVPAGTVVMGYELHKGLGIAEGETVQFMGRSFKVHKTHKERGSKDDITMWINLKEAQELLDKEGLINGILALNCHCSGDRLGKIRVEIGNILPNTQVIEFASQAIARAEARDKAAHHALAMLKSEKENRVMLRAELASFTSILAPLVILGCTLWLALLAFFNVRDRKYEIGLLRALGYRGNQILFVFLSKALFIGLVGGTIGVAIGLLLAMILGGNLSWVVTWASTQPEVLLFCVAAAPILTLVASWLPALSALQQHPADVLRGEA